MADVPKTTEPFSLSRWSRRKREAARGPAPVAPVEASVPAVPAPIPAPASASAQEQVPAPKPLPPVESLTIDSDFSAFMQPAVDRDLKRSALQKLFTDPRFNEMDGLDIYVGDYTKADPMPEGMLEKLAKVYKAIEPDEAEGDAETAVAREAELRQVPDATPIAAPAPVEDDSVVATAKPVPAEPSAS